MTNSSASILVIGDVHGQVTKYHQLLRRVKQTTQISVQIGDMGFESTYQALNLEPTDLFFPGNHDDHTTVEDYENCLGRFGKHEHFFFVGGGHSIDQKWRTPYFDWWPNEELNKKEQEICASLYTEAKPRIMLTHECPDFIVDAIGKPGILPKFGYDESWRSSTAKFLGELYEIHQPEIWAFGHHHQKTELMHYNTFFRCVDCVETGDYFVINF